MSRHNPSPLSAARSAGWLASWRVRQWPVVRDLAPRMASHALVPVLVVGAVGGLFTDLPNDGLSLLGLLAGGLLSSGLWVWHVLQIRLRNEAEVLQGREAIALLLHDFETQSDAWSWAADREGRLTHVAPRMARELGAQVTDQLLGQALPRLLRFGQGGPSLAMQQGFRDAPEAPMSPDLMQLMACLNGHAPFRGVEVQVRSPVRRALWWSVSGVPVLDEIGLQVGWRGVVRDVTMLHEQSSELARLAHLDTLTGLANRHVLQSRAERAVTALAQAPAVACEEAESPLSLYLLDLDNFKTVNDHFGHLVGDRLLQEVARRLQRCVDEGPSGGVLARLGGDEFALLMEQPMHIVEREALALAMLATLREPWITEDLCIEVRASLGVAAWRGPEDTASLLLQHADIALYEAKAAGRDLVRLFDAAMGERMAERHLVIHELGQALTAAQRALAHPERPEADLPCGRLSVQYQPQHDVSDGRLTGFEALVRWRHPRRGWISPAQFIPVAEETGLVVALGEWVLRQACHDAAGWGGDSKIAVNVSGVQLVSRHLVRTVAQVLGETGLAPHRLELEVTETAVLADPAAARTRMQSLRSLGVGLGLDDFGTGYSSLAYLRSYPINTLKIDRSFITGLAEGAQADMILRTIIQLGQGLGMKTLAEGVETAEQLETLRRHGCLQVQGYLFAAAMTAKDAAERVFQARRAMA